MLKKTLLSLSPVLIILSFFLQVGTAQTTADDLWGNKIDIQKAISGKFPTVIVPFSTSNCGYCLIDGFYVEKNYIGNNDKYGGNSYHMSLFNPQLDIYAFQKHFKWTGTILTAPTALHKYHEDGFPTLLAFKDGIQLLRDFYNYAKFDTLKTLLWDTNTRLIPTGEIHIANAFMYENQDYASVIVFPPGAKIPEDEVKIADKWKFSCKHLDELTPQDLQKHLRLEGAFDFKTLRDFFPENSIPVGFKENRIIMGAYSFNFDSTGIYACFPSPFNKEKYIVIEQNNSNSRVFWQINYLDYILFTGNKKETAQRLLYGHFDKTTDYHWKFDDSDAFSDSEKSRHCTTVCQIPEKKKLKANKDLPIHHSYMGKTDRDEWIIGDDNCRFPEITNDPGGRVWVSWEENGNIGLAMISEDKSLSAWFVENNESDSYNPKIAICNNEVWVFYLNDRDGYYRLYARSFDGIRFSDEMLLTEKGPFDVITPGLASDGKGELTIAWSSWKANFRYLYYRKIRSGILGNIERIIEVPSIYTKGYTNAWYPSLCYDLNHDVRGAWNQHYPANFGVFSGKLGDSAVSVTQTAKEMDDRENGGYPAIFSSTDGRLSVAWESFAWDVYYDSIPQKIKISEFSKDDNKWSVGKVISMDDQAMLNQTPSGTCDLQGNRIVVWSGRPRDESRPWGLYLASEKNGKWGKPALLSEEGENDRHPKILTDAKGMVWISCHTGTGSNMKVKVIRLKK
jgi:hypothetical protein